ncbi:MAG: nuclear transport factor 2 family protein [Pseudoxanthomonas sp.]|nr:nuclear transport factor 2 family protein [Pseudoxanthomonas sp.]
MNAHSALLPMRALLLGVTAVAAPLASMATSLEERPLQDEAAADTEIVRRAFAAWAAGTGGPYQLLDEDARWTIVGRSAAAGVYPDRESFMREVIRPFNARMREPLKPTIRRIFQSGDTVIVFFDARGLAHDGIPYENTYTWYLTMRDGRIAASVAFFDSIAFDELWRRVPPAAGSAR